MVQEQTLKEYLEDNYYIEEGLLKRAKTYRNWKKGREVGTVGLRGYKTLWVLTRRYYVHQLIFLMTHGYIPDLIDHINGDKLDNRPENLRGSSKVSNALNLKGCHRDNVSGYLGVTYRKDTGKFVARFRNKTLGSYKTAKEAHDVYNDFKGNEGVISCRARETF